MEQATIFASIVAAAIADVSFACAAGASFVVLMLRDAPPLTRDRLRRFAAGGVAILIVANIINLLLEAALMSGSAPVAAFAEIVPVLTESSVRTGRKSRGLTALDAATDRNVAALKKHYRSHERSFTNGF